MLNAPTANWAAKSTRSQPDKARSRAVCRARYSGSATSATTNPAPMARNGWIIRNRIKKLAVDEKSSRMPSAKVWDGNSVSPRAVMTPATATRTRAIKGPDMERENNQPPARGGLRGGAGGKSERGQQQEGVDQMSGQRIDPAHGFIAGNVPQQNQRRSQECFGEDEDQRPAGPAARRVAGREGSPGPYKHRDHGQERDAAHDPVGELDHRRDLRNVRQNFSVAEGPVSAAAGSGTRGSHQSAPEDHRDVIGENPPGERGKAALCCERVAGRGCRGVEDGAGRRTRPLDLRPLGASCFQDTR